MRLVRWTDELDARLRDLWPTTARDQLLDAFEGFTYEALRKRAKRLHLKKTHGAADQQPDERTMIDRLEALGYQLVKRAQITDHVHQIDTKRFEGNLVRIGVVSDTHLCSRHQQLTHLKSIYRRFADEGIDTVLHAGDLLEGIRMYRGWELEVLAHGADEQIAYAVTNYPREKGITTYLIAGNHDLSFMTNAGINVVKRVCEQRPDMRFLGNYGAFLDLPGGMRAYLHHGAGGVPYARSYRGQKLIENFPPGNKPKIVCSGHYHVTAILPDYRNVFFMHPGCFQSQTEFLRRLGLAPDVGGFIIEYMVNPHSDRFDVAFIRSEWIPFRKEIAHDY